MFSVLLTAASFVMIILIGILFNKKGITIKNAGEVIRSIMINLTLPGVIVVNFSRLENLKGEMIIIALMGFVCNVVMVYLGVHIGKRKPKYEQSYWIFGCPAYNIGSFVLPFCQSFLPPLGTVTACMFDVGNSIMCTGGTYAFASEYLSDEKKGISIIDILKRCVKSIPLMTYVVMFTISLLGFKLPDFVVTLVQPIANANTFMAMIMIGLLFRIEFKKQYMKDIVGLMIIRHISAIVLALVSYYLLPFDLVIRQALVLVLFAPVSALAPAYVSLCKGDAGKTSAANSLSIILGIIELTALLLILGLY